jgi:NAD(P)-dependent dehydrogenase (short-subunit alcohol dehydrogenase family)
MSADIRDRAVIVTGVSERGQVGFAVAERFLREGARVIITARRDSVVKLAEELSGLGDVMPVIADLTRDEDVDRLVGTARERFGRLDALVNVAGGLSVIRPLSETAVEEWEGEMRRNAGTVLRVTNAALPLLRESGGAVVNFASPAGIRAVKTLGAYSAAKAAVVAMTRALALEERIHDVRINAIAPGMIDTQQNRESVDDPAAAKFVSRAEIADVVLFLASDASSGISGETVHVMGEGLR